MLTKTTLTKTTAKPIRLRDGTWGAKVDRADIRVGDPIEVVTRAGKRWTTTVQRVVWQGAGVAIVATANGHSTGSANSYRRDPYVAPHGRRCPLCGSSSCAKAWNPQDLCDED